MEKGKRMASGRRTLYGGIHCKKLTEAGEMFVPMQ
jgi:hypothetical protein